MEQVLPRRPPFEVDLDKFLDFLAFSVSINLEEKKLIMCYSHILSVDQIQQLLVIFSQERQKFLDLSQYYTYELTNICVIVSMQWTQFLASVVLISDCSGEQTLAAALLEETLDLFPTWRAKDRVWEIVGDALLASDSESANNRQQ